VYWKPVYYMLENDFENSGDPLAARRVARQKLLIAPACPAVSCR
jgi:hypothetical protein